MEGVNEADWKVFRQLQPIALERFCERALSQVSRIASDTGKSWHKRYLAVYKLIKRRDGEVAAAFNDMRRSTFVRQLAIIQYHELLTEEEMGRFSPETRWSVEGLIEILRK
jgi:hypothetical protein